MSDVSDPLTDAVAAYAAIHDAARAEGARLAADRGDAAADLPPAAPPTQPPPAPPADTPGGQR